MRELILMLIITIALVIIFNEQIAYVIMRCLGS